MIDTAWGLHLEDAAITAVRVRRNGDVPELLDWIVMPIPAGPTGRGPIERRDALVRLARRHGMRDAEVHVGAIDTSCVLRDEDIDPEDADAPPDVKRRLLISLLPGEPDDLEIRYRPGVEEAGPDHLRFRLLGVPRDAVDRTAALLADAGFAHVGLHAAALAPAEILRRLPPGEGGEAAGSTCALLRVGARVSVLEIHGPTRIDRYRVPYGSDDLEGAIAAESGAGTAEAAAALAGSATGPQAAATLAALTPAVLSLASDVERLLAFHASRARETAPATVHPCGYVANLPLVNLALRRAPRLTVEPIPAPPATALARGGRAGRRPFDVAWPTVMPAIGAALLGAGREPELALRPLTSRPPIRRRALWYAAAAIVLFLSLAAWGVAHRRVGRLRDLVERQAALLRLERGESPTMAEVKDARARIHRSIEHLERKVRTTKALRPIEWILRTCDDPRVVSYRLGRVEYGEDGRVDRAELIVDLGLGADIVEVRSAADAHQRGITDRLAGEDYDGAGCQQTIGASGYTLNLSWGVGP